LKDPAQLENAKEELRAGEKSGDRDKPKAAERIDLTDTPSAVPPTPASAHLRK
jgi:hypothetical protein